MNSSVAVSGVVKYWTLDLKGHRLTGGDSSFKSWSSRIWYLRGVVRDIWLIPYILPQDRFLDTAVGEGIRHFPLNPTLERMWIAFLKARSILRRPWGHLGQFVLE